MQPMQQMQHIHKENNSNSSSNSKSSSNTSNIINNLNRNINNDVHYFNESLMLFEQQFSTLCWFAGLKMAYMETLSFRHIGSISAYSLHSDSDTDSVSDNNNSDGDSSGNDSNIGERKKSKVKFNQRPWDK